MTQTAPFPTGQLVGAQVQPRRRRQPAVTGPIDRRRRRLLPSSSFSPRRRSSAADRLTEINKFFLKVGGRRRLSGRSTGHN